MESLFNYNNALCFLIEKDSVNFRIMIKKSIDGIRYANTIYALDNFSDPCLCGDLVEKMNSILENTPKTLNKFISNV